jgi:hypothetical protein
MSVAILGGLDRLKKSYVKNAQAMGYQVKIFNQRVPDLAQRLSRVQLIVIFTGNVAHPMVQDARRIGKKFNIPVGRTHSSSVAALKRCLNKLSLLWSEQHEY